MIRFNADYVSILKANSKRDLVMVVKDFNIRGVDERSIVYYYIKATELPTAGTTSTVSVSLPDGLYSYTVINRSIQTALFNAGAYLINPSGENVFYIQLTENSIYYAAQFDFSATPTTLPTADGTWARPATGLYSSGGTGLPTTTRVPRLIIDNAAFGKVVGLTPATYPSASATVSSAQLSNIIPQIHPTSSYIVRCDLIKNEYVASGDILSAFDRGDAQVGQLISYKPSQYAWMNCHNGARTSNTISIFNHNDTRLSSATLQSQSCFCFVQKNKKVE
ncbi:unnamed protein product [Phytophthora lilii]|uniref:Unnamed protein product n=1 Tax=Phytophthora lilii TaxID=2077276 RepID=A0A9W6U2J7_9STRA|nr:unnamed protein product [Phytophthora lilii]